MGKPNIIGEYTFPCSIYRDDNIDPDKWAKKNLEATAECPALAIKITGKFETLKEQLMEEMRTEATRLSLVAPERLDPPYAEPPDGTFYYMVTIILFDT